MIFHQILIFKQLTFCTLHTIIIRASELKTKPDTLNEYRKTEVLIVNILFFLTPKSDVAYIFEDETLRQTVEKMEHRKFSCIPILNKEGKYTGTISEGDLLWGIKRLNINITDLKQMEDVSIMAIPRRATYKPVHADADMENLLDRAINQNYVPVIDDKGSFIGIITRKEIIKYCYKEMKELSALRAQMEEAE